MGLTLLALTKDRRSSLLYGQRARAERLQRESKEIAAPIAFERSRADVALNRHDAAVRSLSALKTELEQARNATAGAEARARAAERRAAASGGGAKDDGDDREKGLAGGELSGDASRGGGTMVVPAALVASDAIGARDAFVDHDLIIAARSPL